MCLTQVAIACRNMVTEAHCMTALCAQSDRFRRVLAKLAQASDHIELQMRLQVSLLIAGL
jgi:hypothetical protein